MGKNIINSQRGFSLVEVMVVAGLLGGVAVGVMQLTKNMQKGQSTVELASEKLDFIARMKLYMGQPKNCETTFKTLSTADNTAVNIIKVRKENPPPGSDIVLVDLTNPNPKAGGYLFGQGAAQLKITKIYLEGYTLTNDLGTFEEGMLDLVFELEKGAKNKDNTYGSDKITQTIPLQVYVDKSTNTITSCTDPAAGAKASCDVLGGKMGVDPDGNIICHDIEIKEPNNKNGIDITNTSTGATIKMKPNEISLSDPSKGTALHVRSWGTSVDIESIGGPLVFNNKGVSQKYWVVDTADEDGDGETTDYIEKTKLNDPRVQIGGFVPANNDTLFVNGTIYGKGAFTSESTMTATAFNPTSDIRLKMDIESLEKNYRNILELKPVHFKYINAPDEKKHTGFIAQEVAQKFPNLVVEGTDGHLSLRMMEIIPYLLKVIQDQERRIKKLESLK